MEIKFNDSELKVMDVLWEMGEGNALDMVNPNCLAPADYHQSLLVA